MRFHVYCLGLVGIALSLPATAQLTITTGEEFKSKPVEPYYHPRIVEASADGYTFLQLDGEELIFRKMDANHRVISTDQARHLVNKWRFVPHSFLQVGGKMRAIQSEYNKRNKHWELRAGTLDGTKLSGVGALMSYPYYDEARTDKIFGGLFTRYNSSSKIATNEAETRLAFLHNDNHGRGKDDPVKMRAAVYDEALSEVWSREFILPFTDRQWSIGSMKLAADGRLYVLARTRTEVPTGKKQKMKPGPWELVVCVISETSEAYIQLQAGGSFVQSQHLALTASGCEVIGTYVDKEDRKILGAFHAFVSPGDSDKVVSKIPLEDAELARKAYKDGSYYVVDFNHNTVSGTRKIIMAPVDVLPPVSSSSPTTYQSDGFFVIQLDPSAEVAGVAYTKTKAKPFSKRNIFADVVTVDGEAYILYTKGGKLHELGKLSDDGSVTEAEEVVEPGKPAERLFQENYRVVDGGLFLLLGYGKKATGSFVRF